MLFHQKGPNFMDLSSLKNNTYLSKRCENDPKTIKAMGYSPCFLLRSGQIWWIFFASKMIHIFPKGVKMTQKRSKPWATAHAFCSEVAKFDGFFLLQKWFIFFHKVWKWPKNDQSHGLKPMLFAQKWPNLMDFSCFKNGSYFSTRCGNDPKTIKAMG